MAVQLDYNVPDDPRLAEVGFVGFFALVSSLCYSDRNDSDGFVPAIILRRQLASWGEAEPDQVIERMTHLGIYTATERNRIAGFQIDADYLQWQWTAAEKADRRQKKSEAGRRGGLRSGEARRKHARSKPEADAKHVLQENEAPASGLLEANAKQNEANSNSNSRSTEDQNQSGQRTTSSAGFNVFWAVWPKKKAKADAEKAWKKLQPDADLVTRIIAAVEQQRQSAVAIREIARVRVWRTGTRRPRFEGCPPKRITRSSMSHPLCRKTAILVYLIASLFAADRAAAQSLGPMQTNSAASCSNWTWWNPVYQPDAESCRNYCIQNGADACEWNISGECYVEFGTSCTTVGGYPGWYSAVKTSAPPPPPPGGMQANSAVRGCSNWSWWNPVHKPDPASCENYCAQNNANACEWNVNGECYVELGNGCSVQSGFSGWYARVFNSGTTTCNPAAYGAVPTDALADDWGIQQCLNQGGTTLLASGGPGYLITNTLSITHPGTTLTGPDPYRADLVATTSLDTSAGKRILQVNGVDNVTLAYLRFDGKKDTRSATPCGQTFEYGKNLVLTGNGFRILNVLSENALCGSAAEVSGSGFEIAHSIFRNNGYPEDQGGPWADGLTVWRCGDGSSIHDNQFLDNTDIDLVVGGGGACSGGICTCSVTNNIISNTIVHAFGGIHIGWFPGGDADHRSITYSGNTITSEYNMLSFGLLVGYHPWYSQQNLVGAGWVSGNNISGSVINLQIEADSSGVATGTVTGNPVWNAQGWYGYGTCAVSADYAVYGLHAGRITYDPGALSLQYDDGQCIIR